MVFDGAMAEPDLDRLRGACVPPDANPSFVATRQVGLAFVEPLNARAEAWLRSYAGDEASWNGPALAIEMRYWPLFVDAAIDAGHTFERDAFLT